MKAAVVRARVPEELKEKFESAAAAHQMSLSNAMRMLMTQYVEQEKEKAQRWEETLEAIEDVATGRIVAGDTAMEWLSSWGSDSELEPPV